MRFRDIRALDDHKDVPAHLLAKTTFVEPKPEKEDEPKPVSTRRSRRASGNYPSQGRATARRRTLTFHPHALVFMMHKEKRAAAKRLAKRG